MKLQVPLGKPYIKPDIALKEINKVLDSRWLSGGPAISRFEEAVKEYNNDKDGYYVAVSNCTVALELSLLAVNNWNAYSAEDEVIVPSWSWVASAFAINHVGATPVFCDVDFSGVPTAKNIEALITSKTKAIMVVHQMGIPCDMDKINALGAKYSLPIIEDAACALGSEYKGKKIGISDNLVCYSFQARKVITTGEGGMIVTRDKKIAEKLKSLRAFGTNTSPLERDTTTKLIKESFDYIGFNYKISDIQCALGIAHISYLDEEIKLRKQAAQYYNKKLLELLNKNNVDDLLWFTTVPHYCTKYNYQNYHIVVQSTKNPDPGYRDVVISELKRRGIGCKWDIQQIHKEPVYTNNYKYKDVVLPQTEFFHNFGLWLPFFAEITKSEQDYVIETLWEILMTNKTN